MNRRMRRAFTLIELLVVIGIILTLAAIISPALSKVKESGRATKCLSNLRQLQLATMQYAGGGSLPAATSTLGGPDDKGKYWENKGWISWQPWIPSSTPGQCTNQIGVQGIYCITNGTLYPYLQSLDVYMCPSFKIANAINRTYARGYSMNSGANGASIFSAGATTLVLYGDDSGLLNPSADGAFIPATEMGRVHGGGKIGHAIYLDGHVEKR